MRKLLIILVILVLSFTLVAKVKIPNGNLDLTIYPNPMEEATSISFNIKTAGYVVLEILDRDKMVVATIVSDYLQIGSYVYEWDRVGNDGSILNSGHYVIQIHKGKRFVTKRKTLILK